MTWSGVQTQNSKKRLWGSISTSSTVRQFRCVHMWMAVVKIENLTFLLMVVGSVLCVSLGWSKDLLSTFFSHLILSLSCSTVDFGYHSVLLQYVQPHEHEKLSQVELLVIDEAAAIPLPVVKSLLGPYLIFLSSTVNGYTLYLFMSRTCMTFSKKPCIFQWCLIKITYITVAKKLLSFHLYLVLLLSLSLPTVDTVSGGYF